MHEEGEADVGLMCEEIIDTALEMDSRDNMTCCVVMFPSASNTIEQRDNRPEGGVLKRRLVRQESWGHDSTPAKRAQARLDERREKQQRILEQTKAKSSKTSQIRKPVSAPTTASSQLEVHINKAKKHKVSNDASRSRIRGSNNNSLRLQVNSESQSRQHLVAT